MASRRRVKIILIEKKNSIFLVVLRSPKLMRPANLQRQALLAAPNQQYWRFTGQLLGLRCASEGVRHLSGASGVCVHPGGASCSRPPKFAPAQHSEPGWRVRA